MLTIYTIIQKAGI